MTGPVAAAKARKRTPLPNGMTRAIADDGIQSHIERGCAINGSGAILTGQGGARPRGANKTMSVADTTATSHASIATAVRESAQGAADKVSTESASAQTMMHKKKQQRLLEKVDTGRPWTEVMKSAPVGTAALTSAPKLSDFKVGTRDERVREHAAAMQRWGQNNLTTKAIEYATRVRELRGGSIDRGVLPATL